MIDSFHCELNIFCQQISLRSQGSLDAISENPTFDFHSKEKMFVCKILSYTLYGFIIKIILNNPPQLLLSMFLHVAFIMYHRGGL